MRFGRVGVVAVLAAAVSGCMTEGKGGYSSGGGSYSSPSRGSSYSSSSNDSPSIHNTSGGAREALKAGCRERYPDNSRKYNACLEGDRHSEDALAVGCNKRYPGNGEKIRRCMAGN